MRKCIECGLTKPVSKFIRHYTSSTGIRNICYRCQRIKQRERDTAGKYWQTEKAKKRIAKYQAEYRKRPGTRVRAKAVRKLNYEIEAGRLKRPTVCSKCGTSGKTFAHHHDYSKPLEVTWLCRPCHMRQHYPLPQD